MFDNSYISERIYLKGSLRNREDGFEFTLRNRIDTGTMAGFKSLSVDGFEIPLSSITLQTPVGSWPAADVNFSNPVTFYVGQDARVIVSGNPLVPGEHNFVLTISVLEIGRAQVQFSDTLQ